MVIETHRFRIIRDPANSRLWAYEFFDGLRTVEPVGGFKSPKDARRAFERSSKERARGD